MKRYIVELEDFGGYDLCMDYSGDLSVSFEFVKNIEEVKEETKKDDVWTFAGDIMDLNYRELEECFDGLYPFTDCTYEEAKKMYDEWMKTIRVGDEVRNKSNNKLYYVTCIEDSGVVHCIEKGSGRAVGMPIGVLVKTGEHCFELERFITLK